MSDKVSREVAEQEFARFGEAMDLDFDTAGMSEEDLGTFEDHKEQFIKAAMDGRLTVNESGEPVYQPRDSEEPITFHEPTGATFMATDGKKKGHDVHKAYAAMADMTKQTSKRFAQMLNRDLKVCMTLFALFQA